jgi:uncharacterized membrane protein
LVSNTPVFVIVMLIIVAMLAYGLTNAFSGRGVYIHIGALLGTLMTGNVFWVIIPAQKDMLTKISQGEHWNSSLMEHSRLRSTHNNYMTLPVLFFMLSNHYPALYNHSYNWIILVGLILIAFLARHYFNLKHRGENQPIILVIALAAFLILATAATLNKLAATVPPVSQDTGQANVVTASRVVAIIEQRCNSCHSLSTSGDHFRIPPKEIIFDNPKQIQQYSQQIKRVAIDSDFMPPANQTGMTREERKVLATWITQGALID